VESYLHSPISRHGIHKNNFLVDDVLFHDETQEQEEGKKERKKERRREERTPGGRKVIRLVDNSHHFMAMYQFQQHRMRYV
jgi:hypothetical protein